MSVTLTWASKLKVVETSAAGLVSTQDATRTYNGLDSERTLNSDSTPDAEDAAFFRITISGGVGSIDFTALAHQLDTSLSVSKSATGKKLRAFKLKAGSGNAAVITVAKGASNGYAPLSTTFSRIIAPGGEDSAYLGSSGNTIDSSNKIWDLTGTNGDYVDVGAVWG